MKTSLLYLFFAVVSIATVCAQSSAPAATTPPATTAPSDEQQARMEKFRAALEKLDLTDAQKAQIKQIRATVTDRKERRQQIMAVLTPAQKERLREMIKEHRAASQAGAT